MPGSRKPCLGISAYLSFALLVSHILSVSGAAQIVADANPFPISLKAEAFLDRPTTIKVSFKIFFPKDNERYLPVSAELAEILSSPPDVNAKPELRVRVKSTACVPEDIIAVAGTKVGTVKGGMVNCEIEIAPVQSVKKGTYDVSLAFSTIDTAFLMLGSIKSFPKALAQIQVEVWPSPEARQEALRAAEEERMRKEAAAAQARRAQEEAETQARRQREQVEAKALREARIRILKNVGPYLGLGLLLAVTLFLMRKWLWPDFKARTTVGRNMQFDNALAGQGGLEPGVILHTAWARAWHGTRRRIKLETLVPETTHNRIPNKLALLISVGGSVTPGVYLAILPGGAVRVRVSNDAPQ